MLFIDSQAGGLCRLANLRFSWDPVRDYQGNERQHCQFYDADRPLIYVPTFGDKFTFDPFLTGCTRGR